MTHSSEPTTVDESTDRSVLDRRRFIAGAGAVTGAGLAGALAPAGSASAAVPAGASRFVPLDQAVRLADTRTPGSYPHRRVSATQIRVFVGGEHGVPADATAAVLTVTAGDSLEPNFVTAFPTGDAIPNASNLNLAIPGDVNANLVTVKTGSDGSVDVAARVPCDLIVDVLGYYEPVTGAVTAGRFVGLSSAKRAIDTRPAAVGRRSFTTVDITGYVPADASSVVINLTATETTAPGFFTAVPNSVTAVPKTSSLNVVRAGDTRAAAVIVPVETVGGRRLIKIFSLERAKLIVDVTGYFTGESSAKSDVGLFVPVAPVRLLDTRDPGVNRLWPGWSTEVAVPSYAAGSASAVVLNVTGTETFGPGFLTVSAARRPIPQTSNVNFSGPNQVVPNHVITPVTKTHGFQILSSHGTHAIADFAGYFTGAPLKATVPRRINPDPPPAATPWILNVPRMGLTSSVQSGPSQSITDSGHSWHWAGTGWIGEQGRHVATFAHRTSAGAPYYALDWLQVGDLFSVTTGDGREYTYRMVRRDLTDAVNRNILNATEAHPGTTLSLVACTVGFDSSKSRYPDRWAPTSLKYRIVVTGELVGWREL